MAIHTSTPPARGGERARSPKPQTGPVTQAIRSMRKAERIDDAVQALAALRQRDPAIESIPALRELRSALADRIEADIALLDALDPFSDEREADFAAYAKDGLTTVGFSSDMEQDAGEEPEIDVADEPHDPEEDQGAEEDDGFNGAVTFDGVNYGFRPFTLDRQMRR